MRMGVFRERLATALSAADVVLLYQPAGLDWSLEPIAAACGGAVYDTLDRLMDALVCTTAPGDHIMIMSNGGFGGIHSAATVGADIPTRANLMPVAVVRSW